MDVLIHLIVVLVIFGLVLYLIRLLPIDAWIKTIIEILAILAVILWLLSAFSGFHLHNLPF